MDRYAPSYRLPCLSKRITYGMGHIINDLTYIVFSNYVLIYLANIVQLNFVHVGYAVLSGYVISALASVFADRLGQKRNLLLCCYSKRKSWHIIGSVLVICGFLLLFMPNLSGEQYNKTYKGVLYYTSFIILFQIGWSFVQSSHLGFIPEITRNQRERIELNAIRYAVGIMVKIMAFSVIWLLLSLSNNTIFEQSGYEWFRVLAITVVVTGFVTSAIFHIGTDETAYDLFLDAQFAAPIDHMTSQQWLKETQYYQVVFLHMFTSVSNNVAIMYLPLFVLHTLNMDTNYLVLVPFVTHLSATLIPFALRPLARCTSPKVTYLIGVLLVVGMAIWTWFIRSTWPAFELQVFGMSVLLGGGGAVTTFSSLNMAQIVVGGNTESGGFVFSSMSVIDKVITGIALVVINKLRGYYNIVDETYYRYVYSAGVGGAAVLGVLILLTLMLVKLGKLRNQAARVRIFTDEKGTVHSDAHMDHFESNATEDCLNYWTCLSTTRETQAHKVAIIFSPASNINTSNINCHGHSSSSHLNINTSGRDVLVGSGGLPSRSESLDSPLVYSSPAVLTPSLIEYSGNYERHHHKKNKYPKISKRDNKETKDTAGLVKNEKVPVLTNGLHVAAATNTQADVHPIPCNDSVTTRIDDVLTIGGQVTPPVAQGSPYDNVQVSVTPGGKFIDPESHSDQ